MSNNTIRAIPGLSRADLNQSMGARFSSLRRASVSDSNSSSPSEGESPPTAGSNNEHATMATPQPLNTSTRGNLLESQEQNHEVSDADVNQLECAGDINQPQPEQQAASQQEDHPGKKAPSSGPGAASASVSALKKSTTSSAGEERINPPQGSDSCTGGIRCSLSAPKSLESAAFCNSSIKTEFRVWEFPGVLSHEQCDVLIAQGAGKWQRSRVQVRGHPMMIIMMM